MKKHIALFSTSAFLTMTFWIPSALATDMPTLDPITSPVHATKAVISGHANPGDKIIITGGTYEIPPIYADDTGYFELQVSLIQESTNIYSVKADDGSGASEQIQVEIIEGVVAAAQAEAEGGGDRTAPPAPTVYTVPAFIDAGTYLFAGTAESDSTILISGTQGGSTRTTTAGKWQIFLNLKQNEINHFTFTSKDAAGNVSPGVKVTIEEKSTTPVAETNESNKPIIQVINLSDINDHWAKDYIIQLVSEGVVSGYDDGTFRPDNPVTRAEFIKMVVNGFGYQVNETPATLEFTDVENSAWFATYVEAAATANIVDGYSDGTFRPGNTINRAEAMKILLAAAGIEPSETSSIEFPDVAMDAWFTPYVLKAREMGIVSGYADGNFGPGDPMTRGQVAKVIVELMGQL